MDNSEVEKEVENNNKKTKWTIIILVMMLIISYLFITIIIPDVTSKKMVEKEHICQKLCETKNMTYKETDTEQNCMCSYKNEPEMKYTVGIIQENNSVKEPEPLIMERADGTKFTCKINKTTQKIFCEDIKKNKMR